MLHRHTRGRQPWTLARALAAGVNTLCVGGRTHGINAGTKLQQPNAAESQAAVTRACARISMPVRYTRKPGLSRLARACGGDRSKVRKAHAPFWRRAPQTPDLSAPGAQQKTSSAAKPQHPAPPPPKRSLAASPIPCTREGMGAVIVSLELFRGRRASFNV